MTRMIVEPTTGSLLLGILADVAREGVPRLFAYLDRRYGTSEYDLGGGAPVTARVRFTFRTMTGATPYWVLLGMQSRDGERIEAPVRYGDALEIVVPRAWYEVVALFLSKPLAATHKPTLLALGTAYEGAIGARQQQVSLVGQYPSPELVAWLDARIPPTQRPFRLPTQLPNALSAGLLALPSGLSTRPARTSLPGPGRIIGSPAAQRSSNPAMPTTGGTLRRVMERELGYDPVSGRFTPQSRLRSATPRRDAASRPATSRLPGPPAAPSTFRVPTPSWAGSKADSAPAQPRPKRAGPAAKPKPPPPPDGQCQARTRRGTRCQNWSQGARGNVCDMHLDMVAQGKNVLWHQSGQPIRLRKT